MSDFVKKKIVEKLARFTKNLKPSDISFKFLTGKGSLNNLELNAQFLTEILQLPPWIQISRVVCDSIKAHVPFMKLGTDPIKFSIGLVVINVSTCVDEGPRKKHTDLLDKIGSNNPSSYGFTEKVIDGMRVEIRSILVHFTDPTFTANLEMTDILIQSTTPDWQPAELPSTRRKIADEDSVVTFKMCSWSGVKIEGWSTTPTTTSSSSSGGRNKAASSTSEVLSGAVLRMIANETKIRIAFKRNMSDSSLMCTRVSVHLGDVIWILTQSQLRALSRLVQTLMDAAVKSAQRMREEREKGSEGSTSSLESLASVSGDTPFSHKLSSSHSGSKQQAKKNRKTSSKKHSQAQSANEKMVKQRISDYRDGKLNIPRYEVIQNSFHLRSGKIDLQLCNDVIKEDGSSKVQGSMLIQLTELVVDVYLDQPAGVGRAQWNMANDLTTKNRDWSRKLIERASKTQYVDLPSVNPSELKERGVVVRCANFSVDALRSEESEKSRSHGKSGPKLPIITSDKKTFNIPDDVYNPAFQISMTLYHYPDKCGTKFLLPRPNIFIYFSPIHINVHQESCLWLVEYVNGVIQTVNLELAVSVKDEGKAFIEEHKAKSVQVPQVPGIDFKVKVLFTKITLPVPEEMSGKGRPKALQVETSAITAKNRTLDTLLTNEHFTKAMKSLDQGWIFDSQETGQFPHYSNDLRSLPTHLRRLLNHKPRSRGRSSTLKDSNSSSSSSSSHGGEREREREREKERENRLPCGSATNPEDRGLKTELNRTEGYHIHTSCVQLAFVDSYTHQATLRTTSFVDDFPIHVWVFIPPSLLDKSLANQEPALSSVPGATPTMGGAHNEKVHDAMISFIAHAPQPIKAKLERLQLLFIMRLKDSFTDFKNSLMKFLVLPSSNNKSATKGEGEKEREEKKSQEGQFDEKVLVSHDAEHLQLLDSISTGTAQARSSSATSLNVNVQQHNMRSASQGGPIPIPDVKTTTTRDGKGSTSTSSDKLTVARASTPSSMLSSGSSESDVSATISGCVVVESVEACIILPSILKAHGMTPSRSGTPIGGNALSPMSPSTPLAGSSSAPGGNNKKFPSVAEAAKRVENAVRVVPKNEVQGSENGVLESKSENPELMWVVAQGDTSLFEGGVEDHFSERAQVSTLPRPSPGSQTTSGSAASSPGVSPAQSQLSLSSQVSQSSQFSQSSQISQSSQFSHSSQINQSSQISQSSQFSLSLNNMSSTHSPSITSLPTLIESGNNRDGPSQSFNYPRGTPTTAGGRGHAPAVPSSLNIRPPMRSLSASHLPPSLSSARPGGSTTAPSQFHPHHPPNTTTSTLVPHSRNSTSTLVHGRNSTPSFQGRQSPVAAGFVHENSPRTGSYTANYVTAAGASSQGVGGGRERGERGTQSERTSPVVHVTAIGGTGTVIETQYESKALWSESPHEESDFIVVERPEDTTTGVARRGVSDRPPEQGVMVEASSLESIQKQRLIESSEDPLPLSSSSTTTPSGYHTGPADTSSSSPARQLSSKSSSLSAASLLNPPKQQLLSSSSRRSSQSSLSSRRLKVQSPPKMEPQYNLVIKVGGICALPNIQAKEISVRASVNNVKLEEVEVSADSASGNNSQRQTPRHQKIAKNESTEVVLPKVKARIILGDKVKELFPEDASNLDIVLIGKANDLDVSLLLPNALVMKDFFDDEYEADNPVPMHLRIENTRVVLMEEAGHGPDHVKTMRIAVDRTDIHRGRRLREGVDVFLERGRELMGRAVSTETLHDGDSREEAALGEGEDEMALVGDGGGVAGRIDVQLSPQGQVELTESFNSFLRELEHYFSRDGRQNSREQVVRVLEQIRTRSLEASVEKDSQTTTGRNTAGTGSTTRPRSNDATTPTHFDFDTVSTFFASYHQSKLSSSPPSTTMIPPPLSSSPLSQASHPLSSSSLAAMATSNHEELMHLRRENERLRQQEAEYQKENTQLLESKENMVKQLSDFDMVTEECMSVKEQLVAYKQVMEKQHEQMEKLLNENTELQRKLAVGARSS